MLRPSRTGRALFRLAPLRLPHQPHRAPGARRGRAPRPRRGRAGDPRPQGSGARPLPLGQVQRQRRLGGDRPPRLVRWTGCSACPARRCARPAPCVDGCSRCRAGSPARPGALPCTRRRAGPGARPSSRRSSGSGSCAGATPAWSPADNGRPGESALIRVTLAACWSAERYRPIGDGGSVDSGLTGSLAASVDEIGDVRLGIERDHSGRVRARLSPPVEGQHVLEQRHG